MAAPRRSSAPRRRYSGRCSVLHLPRRLIDMHFHREGFVATAPAAAAHWRGTKIVQADSHPHVRIGRAHAIRGIEGDPAEIGDIGLGPGVTGLLRDDAVDTAK